MQLPKSVLSQIEGVVKSLLPYESDYEPATPQAQIVDELFKSLTDEVEQFGEWSGFIMYLEHQIDLHKKHQTTVDMIAYSLHERLEIAGYGGEVLRCEQTKY